MFEAFSTSFVAWLMLAATSFKIRRDLRLTSPVMIRVLRIAGAAIMLFTLMRCGAPLTGERILRFLGAASLSGAVAVALLSVTPVASLRR